MRAFAALALALVVAVGLASCTSRPSAEFVADNGDGGEAGSDATSVPDTAMAMDTSVFEMDARPEGSGPTAPVRIANWSPDAPAAGYDVCLAAHGTSTWRGPLLGQSVGDAGVLGDSGMASVQFPSVTNYMLQVTPGTWDVAVVMAGAGCAAPVATATSLPALAATGWYTLAIVGDRTPAGSDPALSVLLLSDDSTATLGTAVRLLDLAPSVPAADFGEGTVVAFVPLAPTIPYGKLATGSATDGGAAADDAGYVEVTASGPVTLSAHSPTGTTDLAVAPAQSLTASTAVTVALVGGKTGGPRPQLVVCAGDGVVGQSTGLYSACSVASM